MRMQKYNQINEKFHYKRNDVFISVLSLQNWLITNTIDEL
jgi:hypothetical protein